MRPLWEGVSSQVVSGGSRSFRAYRGAPLRLHARAVWEGLRAGDHVNGALEGGPWIGEGGEGEAAQVEKGGRRGGRGSLIGRKLFIGIDNSTHQDKRDPLSLLGYIEPPSRSHNPLGFQSIIATFRSLGAICKLGNSGQYGQDREKILCCNTKLIVLQHIANTDNN